MPHIIKEAEKNPKLFASDYLPPEAEEDSRAFVDESLNHLFDAIRQLSEVDRAVIVLHLEEKSYQEIANIVGTNPNNIGVRITRIRERIRRIMDGKIN